MFVSALRMYSRMHGWIRGHPTAVLLQAYAAARMAESVLLGLDGNEDIYECAFVDSSVTNLPFFASKVSLSADSANICVFTQTTCNTCHFCTHVW